MTSLPPRREGPATGPSLVLRARFDGNRACSFSNEVDTRAVYRSAFVLLV